jgi:hypothetical protein
MDIQDLTWKTTLIAGRHRGVVFQTKRPTQILHTTEDFDAEERAVAAARNWIKRQNR